ncbi:DNA polymerase IV [Roseococcus sp. SDR]|uniref:DNA polymerase IV n=1 Tax=Roseococcus sp. SDR TaxID=2835532 RepID=UPI001BCDEC11|nr:DNA polymerase IV [Roseococcus sp. SDR]MBS7791413.1 DNA polymerase IV [Roseococcus sp. SDR]MBV1846727.1 DNA polymerase IV [Roseococcus sp. SDR]
MPDPALCRDCLSTDPGPGAACRHCGGRRVLRHPDLFTLTIAHVDCDAFYASVEKRDRPELATKPVLVGGGRRGVVAACCYIARGYGIRSAMPMFKALAACPDAVVLKPDMAKYAREGARIRALMEALTPLVQPLSIDEAVLDLAGTEALHKAPPAVTLARLAREVEREVGVTISIGLAANRLMAKLAAGRDKPRGFAVIGGAEAAGWLAPQRVGLLPGIGPAAARRLEAAGITRLGQLAALDAKAAVARLGADGPALAARARGEDDRPVNPERETKSVSAETTFEEDLAERDVLEAVLWRMSEKLAGRLAGKGLSAGGVVLKLKTAGFETLTRSARLPGPTLLPETLFDAARPLLARAADGTRYRLLGLGASPLCPAEEADQGDLADPNAPRRAAKWRAVEALRERFGAASVVAGRSLREHKKS